jgi:hypothetical protein
MNDGIVEKLDGINRTLEDIRDTTRTPKTLVEKILEYGGAGVSILGILAAIDIIRNWISGG